MSSLDIHEDLEFHETSWRVARLTMAVLLALMAAMAAGAFGSGPLSHARAGNDGDPVRVEYDRLLRFGASTRLRIHLSATEEGTAAFTLDRELLDAYRVSHITPAPAATRLVGDGAAYHFAAEAGSDAEVIVELQPARRGLVRSAITAGSSRLRLTQFVFP